MPKLRYCCEYCSDTYKELDQAKVHEETCVFNPLNKKCWSCEHHIQSYTMYKCNASIPNNEPQYYDVEDENELSCKYWLKET